MAIKSQMQTSAREKTASSMGELTAAVKQNGENTLRAKSKSPACFISMIDMSRRRQLHQPSRRSPAPSG